MFPSPILRTILGQGEGLDQIPLVVAELYADRIVWAEFLVSTLAEARARLTEKRAGRYALGSEWEIPLVRVSQIDVDPPGTERGLRKLGGLVIRQQGGGLLSRKEFLVSCSDEAVCPWADFLAFAARAEAEIPRARQAPQAAEGARLPLVGKYVGATVAQCPRCGREVGAGAAFCQHCGQPLERSASCPACRAEVPTNAAFCPHCGKKLG